MVSIIIPCYNQGQFLKEAIHNLEPQNEFYEVIIVNDGSTDKDSLEAILEVEKLGFNLIHQENKGLAEARNTAIKNSKGEYILPLDSDNSISLDYINQASEILNKNPEIGVVYSDYQQFGAQDKLIELPDFELNRFLAVNYIDACAVYRRTIWEKAGGYDATMPHQGYEDWDLWISAIEQGYQFSHINQPLYQYRVSDTSMSTTFKDANSRSKLYSYIINKYVDLYSEHYHDVCTYFTKNAAELEKEYFNQIDHIHSLNIKKGQLENQLHSSIEIVHSMQRRINEYEKSKYLKFKRQIKHFTQRFKSNSSSESGSFRYLLVLFKKSTHKKVAEFLALITKHIYLKLEPRRVVILEASENIVDGASDPYTIWYRENRAGEPELLNFIEEAEDFVVKPFFSLIMPVYNPPVDFFVQAIVSVQSQVYENWELCIADDCSTNPEIKKILKNITKDDSRIKVVYRDENGHIAKASNSALELASGDYIAMMDQDDTISKDALFQMAKVINENPDADLIYSDEDKIDEYNFHFEPHFKPQWSPDNLLSRNYISHLSVIRKSLIDSVKGWREGFNGSQDHDLFLRITELTDKIYHIPQVLYHWRVHSNSAATGEDAKPYAYLSGQKALTEALYRRGEEGVVGFLDGFFGYSIRYTIENRNKKVSIIIPTKDKADLLITCFDSIFEKTTYQNFEIILLDNNSSEKSFFEFVEKWKAKEPKRFKYVEAKVPFNFANLMNIGFKHTDGDYIVLLNNDTEIISPDWLEGMIEQAQRPSIGVVGCKLLFPNDTIQHAGVVIGIGGIAGHVFIGLNRNGPGYFNYVNMINNYSAVTAACSMFRREVFEEVNGFDENYAVEYNDVDFCLRVKENGYNNIYLPHVELYHHESITRGHPHATKESLARHKKEAKQFRDKWKEYTLNDPCYSPNFTLRTTDFAIRV